MKNESVFSALYCADLMQKVLANCYKSGGKNLFTTYLFRLVRSIYNIVSVCSTMLSTSKIGQIINLDFQKAKFGLI